MVSGKSSAGSRFHDRIEVFIVAEFHEFLAQD
jgi:hypothetical protein